MQIMIGAAIQALQFVTSGSPGREHDDAAAGALLPELGRSLEATAVRQHHVNDGNIRLRYVLQKFSHTARLLDMPAAFLQKSSDLFAQFDFIFQQHDFTHLVALQFCK
jgi:hypothetical protein